MSRVFIAGWLGNMGQRYLAVLKFLGIPYCGLDVPPEWTPNAGNPNWLNKAEVSEATHILVATPTHTHYDVLKEYLGWGLPVLCEKPVIKDIGLLEEIIAMYSKKGVPLTMLNQYKYMTKPTDQGETYYNYFRTGGDGLHWDCINLIGLAKGKVEIGNVNPIWTCCINGRWLSPDNIDESYINMMADWVENPKSNAAYMLRAHKRVKEMTDGKRSTANWDTGQVELDEAAEQGSLSAWPQNDFGTCDRALPPGKEVVGDGQET